MDKETRISKLILLHMCGELDAAGRAELRSWVEASDSHRRLFRDFCSLQAVAEDVSARETVDSDSALQAMRRRLATCEAKAAATPQARGARLVRLRGLVAAAAIVFAVVLVGLGGWEYHERVSRWKNQAVANAERSRQIRIKAGTTQAVLRLGDGSMIRLGGDAGKNKLAMSHALGHGYKGTVVLETPRGGEYTLTMTDGTEVRLNAGSRIEYPAVFNGKERRVKTAGEVYFKVAHDAAHPFTVETEGQEVRVLGTEFNVNAYPAGKVVTTLIRGSIALRPIGGKGGELTLRPGEQAEYDKRMGTATIRAVNTDMVASWTHGKFVFENQTLEQIMEQLSRWYDFSYAFSSQQVAGTVFMGSVPRYGNFQDVLRILEMSGGIKFRVKGKNVEIMAD